MNIKQNKGFSLIELMVVVAIIGILATVAVPNFMKFQAKAKQSNAKVELAGIYTAQKAFQIEYETFHSNLTVVGYIPDGYPMTGTCPAAAPTAGSRRLYAVGFTGAGAQNTALGGRIVINCANQFAFPSDNGAAIGAGTPAAAVVTAAGAAFITKATGIISTAYTAANADTWTINESKVLKNSKMGF